MMENLYHGLVNFSHEEIEQLLESCRDLQKQNIELGESSRLLEEKVKTLTVAREVLKRNFSSLLLTAKAEIERKDARLKELQSSLDESLLRAAGRRRISGHLVEAVERRARELADRWQEARRSPLPELDANGRQKRRGRSAPGRRRQRQRGVSDVVASLEQENVTICVANSSFSLITEQVPWQRRKTVTLLGQSAVSPESCNQSADATGTGSQSLAATETDDQSATANAAGSQSSDAHAVDGKWNGFGGADEQSKHLSDADAQSAPAINPRDQSARVDVSGDQSPLANAERSQSQSVVVQGSHSVAAASEQPVIAEAEASQSEGFSLRDNQSVAADAEASQSGCVSLRDNQSVAAGAETSQSQTVSVRDGRSVPAREGRLTHRRAQSRKRLSDSGNCYMGASHSDGGKTSSKSVLEVASSHVQSLGARIDVDETETSCRAGGVSRTMDCVSDQPTVCGRASQWSDVGVKPQSPVKTYDGEWRLPGRSGACTAVVENAPNNVTLPIASSLTNFPSSDIRSNCSSDRVDEVDHLIIVEDPDAAGWEAQSGEQTKVATSEVPQSGEGGKVLGCGEKGAYDSGNVALQGHPDDGLNVISSPVVERRYLDVPTSPQRTEEDMTNASVLPGFSANQEKTLSRPVSENAPQAVRTSEDTLLSASIYDSTPFRPVTNQNEEQPSVSPMASVINKPDGNSPPGNRRKPGTRRRRRHIDFGDSNSSVMSTTPQCNVIDGRNASNPADRVVGSVQSPPKKQSTPCFAVGKFSAVQAAQTRSEQEPDGVTPGAAHPAPANDVSSVDVEPNAEVAQSSAVANHPQESTAKAGSAKFRKRKLPSPGQQPPRHKGPRKTQKGTGKRVNVSGEKNDQEPQDSADDIIIDVEFRLEAQAMVVTRGEGVSRGDDRGHGYQEINDSSTARSVDGVKVQDGAVDFIDQKPLAESEEELKKSADIDCGAVDATEPSPNHRTTTPVELEHCVPAAQLGVELISPGKAMEAQVQSMFGIDSQDSGAEESVPVARQIPQYPVAVSSGVVSKESCADHGNAALPSEERGGINPSSNMCPVDRSRKTSSIASAPSPANNSPKVKSPSVLGQREVHTSQEHDIMPEMPVSGIPREGSSSFEVSDAGKERSQSCQIITETVEIITSYHQEPRSPVSHKEPEDQDEESPQNKSRGKVMPFDIHCSSSASHSEKASPSKVFSPERRTSSELVCEDNTPSGAKSFSPERPDSRFEMPAAQLSALTKVSRLGAAKRAKYVGNNRASAAERGQSLAATSEKYLIGVACSLKSKEALTSDDHRTSYLTSRGEGKTPSQSPIRRSPPMNSEGNDGCFSPKTDCKITHDRTSTVGKSPRPSLPDAVNTNERKSAFNDKRSTSSSSSRSSAASSSSESEEVDPDGRESPCKTATLTSSSPRSESSSEESSDGSSSDGSSGGESDDSWSDVDEKCDSDAECQVDEQGDRCSYDNESIGKKVEDVPDGMGASGTNERSVVKNGAGAPKNRLHEWMKNSVADSSPYKFAHPPLIARVKQILTGEPVQPSPSEASIDYDTPNSPKSSGNISPSSPRLERRSASFTMPKLDITPERNDETPQEGGMPPFLVALEQLPAPLPAVSLVLEDESESDYHLNVEFDDNDLDYEPETPIPVAEEAGDAANENDEKNTPQVGIAVGLHKSGADRDSGHCEVDTHGQRNDHAKTGEARTSRSLTKNTTSTEDLGKMETDIASKKYHIGGSNPMERADGTQTSDQEREEGEIVDDTPSSSEFASQGNRSQGDKSTPGSGGFGRRIALTTISRQTTSRRWSGCSREDSWSELIACTRRCNRSPSNEKFTSGESPSDVGDRAKYRTASGRSPLDTNSRSPAKLRGMQAKSPMKPRAMRRSPTKLTMAKRTPRGKLSHQSPLKQHDLRNRVSRLREKRNRYMTSLDISHTRREARSRLERKQGRSPSPDCQRSLNPRRQASNFHHPQSPRQHSSSQKQYPCGEISELDSVLGRRRSPSSRSRPPSPKLAGSPNRDHRSGSRPDNHHERSITPDGAADDQGGNGVIRDNLSKRRCSDDIARWASLDESGEAVDIRARERYQRQEMRVDRQGLAAPRQERRNSRDDQYPRDSRGILSDHRLSNNSSLPRRRRVSREELPSRDKCRDRSQMHGPDRSDKSMSHHMNYRSRDTRKMHIDRFQHPRSYRGRLRDENVYQRGRISDRDDTWRGREDNALCRKRQWKLSEERGRRTPDREDWKRRRVSGKRFENTDDGHYGAEPSPMRVDPVRETSRDEDNNSDETEFDAPRKTGDEQSPLEGAGSLSMYLNAFANRTAYEEESVLLFAPSMERVCKPSDSLTDALPKTSPRNVTPEFMKLQAQVNETTGMGLEYGARASLAGSKSTAKHPDSTPVTLQTAPTEINACQDTNSQSQSLPRTPGTRRRRRPRAISFGDGGTEVIETTSLEAVFGVSKSNPRREDRVSSTGELESNGNTSGILRSHNSSDMVTVSEFSRSHVTPNTSAFSPSPSACTGATTSRVTSPPASPEGRKMSVTAGDSSPDSLERLARAAERMREPVVLGNDDSEQSLLVFCG